MHNQSPVESSSPTFVGGDEKEGSPKFISMSDKKSSLMLDNKFTSSIHRDNGNNNDINGLLNTLHTDFHTP